MSDKQIIDLEVDSVQPNPLQPRGLITPESLSELVASIKEHGILEPLVVAKTPAGYQIIAGERRWRAARICGLATVPCIIKETSPRGMLEMAIVENVQREDLNPIDRAQAFLRLMEEFGLTNRDISEKISKSPAYISNSLRLLTLPDALKDGLLTGLITEGHARALAAIEDTNLMVEAYKMVLRESASVRQAEDIARRVKNKAGQKVAKGAENTTELVSEEVDKMQEEMLGALGGKEKASVRLVRSRSQTKITIQLRGDIEQTNELLDRIFGGIVKTEK